jgi:hypothetical protein
MALNKELADKILNAARERFPEPVGNFEDLQALTDMAGKPFDDEWRLALEALEAEGLIQFQHAIRSGVDKNFRGFVNMTVTPKGRTEDIAA